MVSSSDSQIKDSRPDNKSKILFLVVFAVIGSFAAGIMTGSQNSSFTYNNRAANPTLPTATPLMPTPKVRQLTVSFIKIEKVASPIRAPGGPTINPTQGASPTPIRYKVSYKEIKTTGGGIDVLGETEVTPTPRMLGKKCGKSANCLSPSLVCKLSAGSSTTKTCQLNSGGSGGGGFQQMPPNTFFFAYSTTQVALPSPADTGTTDSTTDQNGFNPGGTDPNVDTGEDPPPDLFKPFSAFVNNYKESIFKIQCKEVNPTKPCRPVTKISLVEDRSGTSNPGGTEPGSTGGSMGQEEPLPPEQGLTGQPMETTLFSPETGL